MNEIQLALADNGGDLQGAVDRIVATAHLVEDDFPSSANSSASGRKDRALTSPRTWKP
ncbi:hypothetical protein [Streptomyces agglomeratus]|uniref:hypothetical protein n=1 Tax=Streptomyces agglomeratus TaxID=285458 RepID=UPI0014289028|nr:hypothetical protein [Streptomyces agglomeratus]